MGIALAKLIENYFMKICQWVPCITADAKLDKLLLLGSAHKFSRRGLQRIPLVALNKRLK
jgi:hypothetical protein